MKFKQRWAFLFLIVLMITYLGIHFFEHNYQEKKVKKIYFADRVVSAHKILIDEYNRLNAGKVEVIPVDFPNEDFSTNERKEIVARSLRGQGDGIDIFAIDLIWVQRFAKWCEPLDKYFTEAEKDKIIKEAMESCYYDGAMVAAPLYLVQSVMYYRQDILKSLKNGDAIIKRVQNGLSWNEFIELHKSIKSKNPFFIFPGADYEGFVCAYVGELLSEKPDYFEKNGFNFETPQAEEVLQRFCDLVNKDNMSPEVVTQFTEVTSYDYFIKNDGLFLWGWTSYPKDFQDYPYDARKQNSLRCAPVPHFAGHQATSILGGWDLIVSKFSENKPEAVDFIKFLLRKESQEIFSRESAYNPVVKSFSKDSAPHQPGQPLVAPQQYLKNIVHRPPHEEYTKYSKIMAYYFNLALQKKIPVSEALARCSKAIQMDKLILQ